MPNTSNNHATSKPHAYIKTEQTTRKQAHSKQRRKHEANHKQAVITYKQTIHNHTAIKEQPANNQQPMQNKPTVDNTNTTNRQAKRRSNKHNQQAHTKKSNK